MKRIFVLCFTVVLGLLIIAASTSVSGDKMQDIEYPLSTVTKPDVDASAFVKRDPDFGKIPLYFIPNRGQVDEKAAFYARTLRYTLWMTKEGLVFDSIRKVDAEGKDKLLKSLPFTEPEMENVNYERDVSRLMFLEANRSPEIVPVGITQHKVNFYKGKDPAKWKKNIQTSKAVIYKNIYRNIDLKIYGVESQIEYDWIVKPGGNPEDIRFEYKNAKATKIDKEGNLLIETKFGELLHKRPISYQLVNGEKVDISSEFKVTGENTYAFNVENYNTNYELIIDPVVSLEFSTFLGGSGFERGVGISIDDYGNIYLCGYTSSSNFPITGSNDINIETCEIYITQLNSSGSDIILSTYIGGNGSDQALDMEIAESGYVYLTGITWSDNFPVTTDSRYGGGGDAFLCRLDPSGFLLYSRYIGGRYLEYGRGIAMDSSENAYIVGNTYSSDFPTKNAFQSSVQGWGGNAFVCKIHYSKGLIYSTYLGGEYDEHGQDIAVDNSGSCYVTGYTWSSQFPVMNAFQEQYGGKCDGFVCKFKPDGSDLIYSTFLGGTDKDNALGIVVDKLGFAYIAGRTSSHDFPVKNAYQNTLEGGMDVFVCKLNYEGSDIIYSTYIGGSSSEFWDGTNKEGGIALDEFGCVYISGATYSTDFPTKNAFQDTNGGILDVFLFKLSENGRELVYSTYLGGYTYDSVGVVAVDKSGNAFVTGGTNSYNFPTKTPYQDFNAGYVDVFLSKFVFTYNLTVQSTPNTGIPITVTPNDYNGTGDGETDFTRTYVPKTVVTLTAPEIFNGKVFYKWAIDDVDHFNRTIQVIMNGNHAVSVEYQAPVVVHTLIVQSKPDTGVHIAITPEDNNKNGNGNTNFTRTYNLGEIVTLTAPETFNGEDFYQWAIDGVENFNRTIQVTMSKDHAAAAVYESPPGIYLSRTQLNFGACPGIATTGAQNFLIENTGGLPLNWTVSDNATWLDCSPASGTNFGEVSVSVNGSGLAAGTYTGAVTVSAPHAENSPQTVTVTLTVYSAGNTKKPFGYFATPWDGASVMSSIPVTGWVLDDIEVMSVKIYRQEDKDLVYIGDAVFVEGARPDVEQAYPHHPKNYQAGWGYMMLTNFLPNGGNGTFTLYAIAADKEGHQVTLGTKTIICDNAHAVKPFGAIDTPPQGGTISGTNYRNQGWVLTPQPNKIPEDGHTIMVWINGIDVGKCKYNIYRQDIATLFPGYANSNGALAYFDFDTTAYKNGVHTIQWTAMDNAGNVDGIGSRYFSTRNTDTDKGKSSTMSVTSGNQTGGIRDYRSVKDLSRVPFNTLEPVRIRKGYNLKIKPEIQYPDDSGNVKVEIKELELMEIHLQEKIPGKDRSTWIGFHVIGHRLKALPVGSTLDTKRGVFYWQPGPGFVGNYLLVFIETDRYGNITKKNVRVTIAPKFR